MGGNTKSRKNGGAAGARASKSKSNPPGTAANRVQGVQIYRPFVFGSIAELLPEKGSPARDASLPEDHTHRWTVYVRGVAGADITHWLKKVSFKLHESFAQATRTIEAPEAFQVTETGWGEFEISIRLFFVPEANEKPTPIYHFLKLHPYGPDAETVRERRLPVKSETYTEIVFVEPFEPFYEVLTGGGPPVGGNKGGKGKGGKRKGKGPGGAEDEAARRTAVIPQRSEGGNPFSRETEDAELKRLEEAQEKVSRMIQEQLALNKEREDELKKLRDELDVPAKSK